jgi:carbamoyltransferase
MIVLGLNAFHGDASAALFVDGELACAVEEERLNRKKHCGGFPRLAVRTCLDVAGVRAQDIDHVAVSRDPRAQLLRKAAYLGERAARLPFAGGAEQSALWSALRQRVANRRRLGTLRELLAAALDVPAEALRAELHQVEHHRAHLASAFFPSEFAEAAVLSLDGFGDFVSTMWGLGRDRRIEVTGEVNFPHSLGLLYTAICQWLGYGKYGDEGKIMGLSAYGQPRHLARLRSLVQLRDDGGFALDLRFFRHHREGVDMTFDGETPALGRLFSPALCELLGAPRPSGPGIEAEPYFCDVAASLQALLEESVLHIARALRRRTPTTRLCLAGGVALNCVANGRILDDSGFRELFIQPAAGDNGTSIGAALWVLQQKLYQPRRFVMRHAYTGPAFDDAACAAAIEAAQKAADAPQFSVEKMSESDCVAFAASDLAEGAVLGFYQGRMEFGPRALGHRSILADPRRPEMKDVLNRRIKHREPFRPFAPSVLIEEAGRWFERGTPAPSMLLIDRVRPEKRELVPAITHADGTARLQTVSSETSPLYHALLSAFFARTGVPMVLNTSFNEHEPIVCTPAEALACFLKTHIDVLVLGPYYIRRVDWRR